MQITEHDIEDVYEIKLEPIEDGRGYFMRVYDQDIFNQHGIDCTWVQDSQSKSTQRGIVRGLHFQYPPRAETKLIRVVSGKIFDVYVDLRQGSPTFGEWGSVELSAKNNKMIHIPRGLAHGFCTLTDNVEVFYRIDNYYEPELQGRIRWDSPDLDIHWPIENPVVSHDDSEAASFSDFVEESGGIEV